MDGEIVAGPSPVVTLKDVARACGLSDTAVSWALRGDSDKVSAQTIARVRAMADDLGYSATRNHTARRLRYSQTKQPLLNYMVGLNVNGSALGTRYFSTILEGLGNVLDTHGFGVFLNWRYHQSSAALP
ncbi:MAG TPA: LacI family DNA-binding transcriptional regulator, partial [Armatimonadota bacterium]